MGHILIGNPVVSGKSICIGKRDRRQSRALPVVRDKGRDCWDRIESQWVVDESNRPQPHGCGGRLAQWQAPPDPGCDTLFTAEFLSLPAEAGVASVKLPPRRSQSERLTRDRL